MINTVKNQFPDYAIKSIIGGLHLRYQPAKNNMAGPKQDIVQIANELKKYKNCHLYTGHCTGSKAYDILKNELGDRVTHIYAGHSIEI